MAAHVDGNGIENRVKLVVPVHMDGAYRFTVDSGHFKLPVEGTVTFRHRKHRRSWELPADLHRDFETCEVTTATRGFWYLVNQPGSGVTVQEVGRIA